MKLTSSSCDRHVSLLSGWLLRPSSIACTPHKVMFGPLGFFSGRSFLWVSLVIASTHNTRHTMTTVYLQYRLCHMSCRGFSLSGCLHRRVFLQEAQGRHQDEAPRICHQWDVSGKLTWRSKAYQRSVTPSTISLWSHLLVFLDTRPCWTAGWIVPRTGQRSQSWLNIWATCYRPALNRSVWVTVVHK